LDHDQKCTQHDLPEMEERETQVRLLLDTLVHHEALEDLPQHGHVLAHPAKERGLEPRVLLQMIQRSLQIAGQHREQARKHVRRVPTCSRGPE
jgi:hypothetical protein